MPRMVLPTRFAVVVVRVRLTDTRTRLLHHVHKCRILSYAVSMLCSGSLYPTHMTSAVCKVPLKL